MVWSNIPGANIQRGAEGDNTLQRAEHAGIKRNISPSSHTALTQSRQPRQTQSTAVAHHSSSAQYLGGDNPGVLKTKSIGDNTTVRFNNHYCPELGAAMALARQEVYGSHPVSGTLDLISSRPAAEAFETFTDVPRLVDTLSLLRRQAPSAPLHHFQHGFGSLRTVRPNMTNPAPGWYYYGENKAAGTTAGVGGELPSPRPASCCAAAHPHDQDKAVQTGTLPASKADTTKGIGRAQEQLPIKAQTSSCLDSATILQLLQQQQHESQVQVSADQAGRVSVGCQTRQGDTWRVHSEACQGKPAEESGSWAQHDKAWVPAGTHYLDKQAHEALTPRHPPNSPHGNTCPAPVSSRRHRSPTSTSEQGRTAAKSLMRPPWDTWGSPGKASSGEQSSPCQSPTRAELKKMTASWSPGRKGFVKPELAQAQENRFSHTQGSHAGKTQASKPRKKQKSPKKAPLHKEALHRSDEAGRHAKTGSGASIWAGTPAGPPQPSFLQPVLHSQQSNGMHDGTETQQDRQIQFDSQVQHSPAKRKKKRQGDSRCARAQRQQSQTGEEESQAELDGRSQSQNSPPKIYTLDQSPRGSYVSPFRSSPRRGLSGRHDPSLLMLQSPQHAPRSMRSLNFPQLATQRSDQLVKGPRSSYLSTHRSQTDSLNSLQLNAQPSEIGSDSSCSVSEASQCSGLSEGGQEEEMSWAASSINAESGVNAHTPPDGHKQRRGKAGYLSSSGLRREVQDSLSELEQLIEQQHRQLIARGILLPEEPSCESVATSDLDFSTLSLDSGMDRLSRLADSLVEGVTPGSFGAQRQDAEAADRSLGKASRDSRAQVDAASMVQTATAAGSAESRRSQADRSAAAAAQVASQRQPAASDSRLHRAHSDAHISPEALPSHAESGSQPSWLLTGTDNQPGNTGGSQNQMSHGARQMPGHATAASVQLSDAPSPAYAETVLLCQHSLPSEQRIVATSASEDEQATPNQPESRVVAANGKPASAVWPDVPQSNAVEQFDSAAEASSLASVSASDSPSPQSAGPLHNQSVSHHSSFGDCSESEPDSPVGHRASPSLHKQQQEGLLSDSENEFEQSLVNARMLKPTNTSQAAAGNSATAQSKGVVPPGAFSAHCTVTVAPAVVKGNKYDNEGQETAFSAIFRQTPTDSMAEEAESEAWEEEMVDEGWSEYSGGLSGEPSAAHWAEQQHGYGQLV
ncbi:hypothetical protein WJX77_001675 [Trebouxia sp. C0004]